MKYSELSDFEINHSVAQKVLDFEEIVGVPMFGNSVRWSDGEDWHHFNPCNSWTDAGAIIAENKISLVFDGSEWWADASACWVDGFEWAIDASAADFNPLRAAMIAFLMSKEMQE